MTPTDDDVTATVSSAFVVTGDEHADQICRASMGAGLQARTISSGGSTEVVIDHLVTEQTKVEQLVAALDPGARRTSAGNLD